MKSISILLLLAISMAPQVAFGQTRCGFDYGACVNKATTAEEKVKCLNSIPLAICIEGLFPKLAEGIAGPTSISTLPADIKKCTATKANVTTTATSCDDSDLCGADCPTFLNDLVKSCAALKTDVDAFLAECKSSAADSASGTGTSTSTPAASSAARVGGTVLVAVVATLAMLAA